METSTTQGTKIPQFSESDIMQTVAELRTPEGAAQQPITENTRVDEQELFAAFTYLQLEAQNPELAAQFMSKFREGIHEAIASKSDPRYTVLDVTRNILQGLRKAKSITRGMFKKIRRTSLGLSQLDSIKDNVNMDNVTKKDNDSAMRAFKTAFRKIAENPMATLKELRSFAANNRARLQVQNQEPVEQKPDPNTL